VLSGRLARWSFRRRYRKGDPPWDTGTVPEKLLAVGAELPPGRFLDLGCGTGTTAVHMASLGWEVVGVDFVEQAIDAACDRARNAGVAADFHVGDVTRLADLLGDKAFDLVFDQGCYHGIAADRRDDYAAGLARVTRPGATFLVFGFNAVPVSWRLAGASGIGMRDVTTRFARWFTVVTNEVDEGPLRPSWTRLERNSVA
jgi:ubiquinone/menaquinone biosynthesis C-methylase UbiE